MMPKSPFRPRPGGGAGRNGKPGSADSGGSGRGANGPATRSNGSGAARPPKRPGGGTPPKQGR